MSEGRLQGQLTDRSVLALAGFLLAAVEKQLEPVRVARAGCAVLAAGWSIRVPLLAEVVPSYLLSHQNPDGGWCDTEETAWCAGYLTACGGRHASALQQACCWLRSERNPQGGWGRTSRDWPRIPLVGLLCALVPGVVDGSSIGWVAAEWAADLHGQAPLSYKAGFFLISQSIVQSSEQAQPLIEETLGFLIAQQNEDGGFGPWRDHPAGSDPCTTGIVLWGLRSYSHLVPTSLYSKASAWLLSTQLPSGHWPYHYLDEGTALALIGASSIPPFLRD